MSGPEDTTGRDDRIDDLVRSTLGEISADRFDELVSSALRQAVPDTDPAAVDEPGTDGVPPGGVVELSAARSRSRARAATQVRWLGMAAAVLIGVVAVTVLAGRGSGGGDDVAAPFERPDTTSGGPLDPTVQRDTVVSTVPMPAAGPGRCVPVGADPGASASAGEPSFSCPVGHVEPGDPLGPSTVLFSDDAATLDAVAAPGEVVCVEPRPGPEGVRIEPGDCDGRGMRASADEPGSYLVAYDLRSCPPRGSCDPEALATVWLELDVT